MSPDYEQSINHLIDELGLAWNNTGLLVQAMTHSSCSCDHRQPVDTSNERLELDRKSVVYGKSVYIGGRRII